MYFIGIDVGTGSARAGLFDRQGSLLASSNQAVPRFEPVSKFAQQRSTDVWQAVCHCVQEIVADSKVDESQIRGIGFDATCSLVVTDVDGLPVSVSPGGEPDQDIVMWLDHRAGTEAEEINASNAEQLRFVGGKMSIEMQMPKLLWLKRHLPDRWESAHRFWDLPDWLTWRATGKEVRSICSVVCKWGYLGHRGNKGEGWDSDFLSHIGLAELAHENFAALGQEFAPAGTAIGTLRSDAASEMGLPAGIPVSSGLIDAYAGALGSLGVGEVSGATGNRLAVIAGTSTCFITVGSDPVFVPGIWGPYLGALSEERWALEGGQSAAGALLDAVLDRHQASMLLADESKSTAKSKYSILEDVLAAEGGETAFQTRHRHVQPDFLGNRAPLADPDRLGAISGLGLDTGLKDLALDYLAATQSLGYGTRHILEEFEAKGVKITTLVVSGGLAKNSLFVRELCDITGCSVLIPNQSEPVLLGSAILGAMASGTYQDLDSAMAAMSGPADELSPRDGDVREYHNRKYRVFRRMQDDFAAYRDLMAN